MLKPDPTTTKYIFILVGTGFSSSRGCRGRDLGGMVNLYNLLLPLFLDIGRIIFWEKVQNIGCIVLQHSLGQFFKFFNHISLFLANPSISSQGLSMDNPFQTWCNFSFTCVL